MYKVIIKDTETTPMTFFVSLLLTFMAFSSVSIVYFEQLMYVMYFSVRNVMYFECMKLINQNC